MIPGILKVMTPAFQRMPGYAVCKIGCNCGRMELRKTKNGDVFCRYCGTVVRPQPISEVFSSVDELGEFLGERSEPDNSDELNDKISSL